MVELFHWNLRIFGRQLSLLIFTFVVESAHMPWHFLIFGFVTFEDFERLGFALSDRWQISNQLLKPKSHLAGTRCRFMTRIWCSSLKTMRLTSTFFRGTMNQYSVGISLRNQNSGSRARALAYHVLTQRLPLHEEVFLGIQKHLESLVTYLHSNVWQVPCQWKNQFCANTWKKLFFVYLSVQTDVSNNFLGALSHHKISGTKRKNVAFL